ncbi:UPF0496 protein At1g20180 [Diospyros lotus]|uniref:UPF0496 protein At1g20180 n=1 Tax=Diospyros lotus TaxID=55363 RepID=UPI00225C34C7|nr:UPF0496 protein At1g20180 [Diospyros lotus]
MVWSMLKSPFTTAGRREKKRVDYFVHKLSVNEEYLKVHRTKSYVEILNKVQDQLAAGRTTLDRLASSSSSLPLRLHLSDFVLEPSQETLMAMIESSNLPSLIAEYFDASFQACNTCELLLRSVLQARANYRIIKTVTKMIRHDKPFTDSQSRAVFEELASFATLKNPLLIISPDQFSNLRERHGHLLQRLTKKFQKARRRAKVIRHCKKMAGFSLVVSYAALVIALLGLAVHSVVGVAAAPGLLISCCCLGLVRKKSKMVRKALRTSLLERVGAQLEVAAKGVFILINDFDTMSRLVRRLQDEMEHSKAIAEMCVRHGKGEVLMEVIREFSVHQTGFLEQLEELEEHIYLCFLTINRSRALVLQEIVMLQQGHR